MTQTSFLKLSETASVTWTPTREHAEKRLQAFVPSAASNYARRRNYDLGQDDRSNVSALSPWLSHRLLLEEDVLTSVLAQHSLPSAEKFVQEVLWRGYFKGWLEHHPTVWTRYKNNLMEQARQLECDPSLAQRYSHAVQGETGIACFDAWASELISTGYLHNHTRMWFASIWIFTLKLPWELGADFFYRHLLDGDPASNTCSWRWVGGLHTKGKTYLARAENIEKFTEGRFNPAGQLAIEASPLHEADLPPPTPPTFEAPDTHGQRLGLLITEDDCSPQTLPLPSAPAATLALANPAPRSLWPSSPLVTSFTAGAIEDAARSAEQSLQTPCTVHNEDEWQTAIRTWADANDLEGIITPRMTKGPLQTRLRQATKAFSIPLIEITRDHDQAVWPHTKRGFFTLKKKIPDIIAH